MERVAAVTIDIPEPLLSSARQKLLALSDEPMAADDFTFFRVPAHIRQRNKLLYEPRMVALGPYGRSDERSLQTMEWLNPSLREMEWLKLRYFQSFRSRCSNRSIEDYVALIQELEPQARRCYFERVELCTERFVNMLLLDGCFIIEFLMKWNEEYKNDMFAAEWSLPLIRGDLLLLENQIPLFVLEKLFQLMDSQTHSLMNLIKMYLKVKDESRSSEDINFHHLLHIYYDCYVTKPSPTTIPTATKHQKRLPRTIPTATKLLEAGVKIKKKEEKKNQNQQSSSKEEEEEENRLRYFLDVTFSNGVLEIPFLSVENSTLPRFSNLVAFEQCSRCKPEKAYMTSYAVFMDCLINTREDVAVLHQCGVLENKLASDKELAVFFNQLSDWATLDYENHYLAKLFRDVEVYCGKRWPKWRVTLVRNHLSNPWTIISLIAAAVLFVLTFLQTLYSMYTYYHPS